MGGVCSTMNGSTRTHLPLRLARLCSRRAFGALRQGGWPRWRLGGRPGAPLGGRLGGGLCNRLGGRLGRGGRASTQAARAPVGEVALRDAGA